MKSEVMEELEEQKPQRAFTAEEALALVDRWGEAESFPLHNIARALAAELRRYETKTRELTERIQAANSRLDTFNFHPCDKCGKTIATRKRKRRKNAGV